MAGSHERVWCGDVSDVNKAKTLKAKAIPVGNEAGTVPSRMAMGDHGK